jgi:integrase
LRPRARESSNRGYADQAKPFVDQYGEMLLRDVDVELALEWLEVRKMRWTVGGLRAMFSDARRAGLIERNPFLGLGLSTGPGRKNIEVLKIGQVFELADVAAATWGSDGYGRVWRALVLWQAFVGTRPAEAYGLVRTDLDVAEAEVNVCRQRTPFAPRDATPDELPLPKNGKTRCVVIPPPALDAVQALPRPIDPDAPLFATRRGRPLSGQVRSTTGTRSGARSGTRASTSTSCGTSARATCSTTWTCTPRTSRRSSVIRTVACSCSGSTGTRPPSWRAGARTRRIGGRSSSRCARPRS